VNDRYLSYSIHVTSLDDEREREQVSQVEHTEHFVHVIVKNQETKEDEGNGLTLFLSGETCRQSQNRRVRFPFLFLLRACRHSMSRFVN
jgi:hypothetical protein